ncbi:hypothetical protein ACJU26_04280 [Acidithiobacillus sp. M4-SHS-6]|uniref:hypothetical protein n=1 Tax=Acidithiobacillus sp. M4-SHS-6 TaxID=3383024 RepID=UPI0039BE7EDA
MIQGSLFPVKIVREQAFSGTASLRLTGYALNGECYAIKTVEDNPLLPITEWFCYHLCSAVQIPTPGWVVAERPNKTLAFGSRVDQDTELLGRISTNPVFVRTVLNSLASSISRILSLDYFLPNIDRHINNILVRQLPDNHMIALAFDWSHAQNLPNFLNWPWESPNNSFHTVEYLKIQKKWDNQAAFQVNNAVASIPSSFIREWLTSAPIEWIPNQDLAWIDLVVQSWDQARAARVNQVP